jgi:hypothetical protein
VGVASLDARTRERLFAEMARRIRRGEAKTKVAADIVAREGLRIAPSSLLRSFGRHSS